MMKTYHQHRDDPSTCLLECPNCRHLHMHVVAGEVFHPLCIYLFIAGRIDHHLRRLIPHGTGSCLHEGLLRLY